MKSEIEKAIQACEERKLDSLQNYVPQLISPSTILPTFDRNGIKIINPTFMHIACFSGAYDCVKFLIKCGANASVIDGEIYYFFMKDLLYI